MNLYLMLAFSIWSIVNQFLYFLLYNKIKKKLIRLDRIYKPSSGFDILIKY
jgi:hypothetical protein